MTRTSRKIHLASAVRPGPWCKCGLSDQRRDDSFVQAALLASGRGTERLTSSHCPCPPLLIGSTSPGQRGIALSLSLFFFFFFFFFYRGEARGDSKLPPSRARSPPPSRIVWFGVAPGALFTGGLSICGPSVRRVCKICARSPCFVQRTFLFTLRRIPPRGEERTVRGPSCGSLQTLYPHLRLDCFVNRQLTVPCQNDLVSFSCYSRGKSIPSGWPSLASSPLV